jgi:PPK2 family polyphosphate:nucleotide phosphotransferase
MLFEAAPHPLLVPWDTSFDAAGAPSSPEGGGKKTKDWKAALETEAKALGAWQHRLFADGRYAMLLVFQAVDAAGKDGTIRHVFSAVNPCGMRAVSFKQPTRLELAHDFLWRTTAELPVRGQLTVFNRSYYEEVLAVRVHPELLVAQKVPGTASPALWDERLRAIAEHERHLAHQGTVILKFWLNVSKEEQGKRLLERIDDPVKNWKFDAGDLDERDRWDDYQEAFRQCFNATSKPWAPWYAVPADDKHYMRWQVARLINGTFEHLGVDFPPPTAAQRRALAKSRERLLAQSKRA